MRRSALVLLLAAVVLVSGCFLFQSGILYEETWSDPDTTAWYVGNTDSFTKSIESGRYHIVLKQATTTLNWNDEEGPFGDVQMDVDVKHVAGTDDLSAGGLVFRVTDISNFYMFQVSPAGTYRVVKWVANAFTAVVAWTASDAISTGAAENHLTVLADGTSLTFLINGTEVADLTDSSLSTGYVGVGVRAFDENVDVEESFDNLVVRELD